MKKIIYSGKIKVLLIIMLLSFDMVGQCPPDDFPNDYVYLITQEDVDAGFKSQMQLLIKQ